MRVLTTAIPGLLIVEPRVSGDERGFFLETWNRDRYTEHGIGLPFVQDNLSFSRRGVLRGLHFQNPDPQGKLVTVLQGTVYDVAADIRQGSPTFGEWAGVELSEENRRQFYVPPGLAHGFCVTSRTALVSYKCTARYNPDAEHSLAWDDPDLAIDWPVGPPTLSDRDADAKTLAEFDVGDLPDFAKVGEVSGR